MIRIGIDATRVGKERTGIENFVVSVIKAVPNILENHPAWSISIFMTKEGFELLDCMNYKNITRSVESRLHIYRVNNACDKGWLKEQVFLPFSMRGLAPLDLFYSPGYPISPLINAKRTIIQVHDVTPWRYPQSMTFGARLYWKTLLPHTLKKACKILVDSEFTRTEINSLMPKYTKSKLIERLPVAVSDTYLKYSWDYSKIQRVIIRHGIAEPYFIALGTLEPRKNLQLALDAYLDYMMNAKDCEKADLVFVGGKGWKNRIFINKVKSHYLRNRICLTGWVNNNDLPSLIAGAKAMLFPSKYEGFGLPPLESLAVGTPVVVSRIASMPEVCGNYASYADPSNVKEWSIQLKEIMKNKIDRQELRVNVRTWIAQYSQEIFGSKLDRIFSEVVEDSSQQKAKLKDKN